jgi:ABC-type polar amino acid transport system ATPase subunit
MPHVLIASLGRDGHLLPDLLPALPACPLVGEQIIDRALDGFRAMPMIEVKGLHKSFGDIEVLKTLSFEVDKGDAVVVLGPSGSGKSTLLRCINFLEDFQGGQIQIDGETVGYRYNGDGRRVPRPERENARLRQNVGIVFQSFNLFPHRTALQNIMMGPVYVRKIDKAAARELARDLLDSVGLSDKADQYPATLSGGQQQRVAIVRALAMQPKVMLFDEVTSALDPELVGEVLAVIRKLAEKGMTMIIVTHEIQFARDVGDRILFMDHGRIVEQGAPRDVLINPSTERLKLFLRRYQSDYA